MAELKFVYGAMSSGKSTQLLNMAYAYEQRGLPFVTIKPKVDTKGNSAIVSKGGLSREADILAPPDMDLRRELGLFVLEKTLQIVLIDESQFLEPQQIDQLHRIAKEGTPVTAYGLKTDFRTELFAGSKRLMELADTLEKLSSVICRCGENAEFNCRQVDGEFVFEGEQVAIDGENHVTYDSLCGTCYYQERDKAEKNNSILAAKAVQ